MSTVVSDVSALRSEDARQTLATWPVQGSAHVYVWHSQGSAYVRPHQHAEPNIGTFLSVGKLFKELQKGLSGLSPKVIDNLKVAATSR